VVVSRLALPARRWRGQPFLRAQLRSERTEHSPLLPPTLLSFARHCRRGLECTQLSYFIGVGGFLIPTAISLQTGLRSPGRWPPVSLLVPYAALFSGWLVVRKTVGSPGTGRLIIVWGPSA